MKSKIIVGTRFCVSVMNIPAIMMFLLVIIAHPSHAQIDVPHHTWEVYLQRDLLADGTDMLLFVDVLMGISNTAQVDGERYTPVAGHVMFFDRATDRVMLAATDGTVREHPFIQLDDDARRVDWIIARDQRLIAWTLTYGTSENLRTVTQVASPDGADRRIVLENGPRADGVRALPVAFSVDNSAVFMDAHPDIIGNFAPYTQFAGLFRIQLDDNSIELLPDEDRACFCGAGLRAGQFLRLTVRSDLRGFDVRVYDLDSNLNARIPAVYLDDYTQAGDILISPDGTLAVYALSSIENFGAANQSVSTVFMLVDLRSLSQVQLTNPVTTYVHPVRWTEDNTAVIFTSPQTNGTWKIRLNDGELNQVAEVTFIGTLNN